MSSPEPTTPPWARYDVPVGAAGLWGPPDLGSPRHGAEAAAEPPVDPIEESLNRGFQEGFAAGISQARAELKPLHDALSRAVAEVQRELGSVRHRAEGNLYALGLTVARWLLQREVAEDPAAVEPLIRRAVALLPAGAPVEIHGNAADVEVLSNAVALAEPDGRPIPAHWVTDPTMERGSFRLVSPERIIDGRADVALRSLYERLVGD